MKSRLIQNGAATAIGILLALAAAISIDLTSRLNDHVLIEGVADSARPEIHRSFSRLEDAGRRALASGAPESLLHAAAGRDRFALKVEAVVEARRQNGALRLGRVTAASDAPGARGPLGVAIDDLVGELADWRPENDAATTVRDAVAPDALWMVWADTASGQVLAALTEPALSPDPAQPDTTLAVSVSAEQPAQHLNDEAAWREFVSFGDRVVAIHFALTSASSMSAIFQQALPFLALTVLIALAVIVLMRAQRANLAIFDARQQEIIENIAANQRALEASEERFRHLAESTNVIPWTADLDRQRFTYVGPQIEDLSGYPASTWQASGFWLQHIHPGDRQRIMGETLKRAEEGRYITVEYRIRSADGRTLHIRNMLTVSRVKRQTSNGATVHTLAQGFMLDVSEMKRAAAALEIAREKAEEANRVKSEFLASMSHELRTPLNAVIGFSEIMKDEVFGPLDPRYREYAESVYASGRHLLDLINDVLDLSKIEAGRIELTEEPTDLGGLMMDCRTLLQERMQSAGVRCRTDIAENLPLVTVDERRIKQVLLNLMSNAIKFTPPGGSVEFHARYVPERGVLLAVRDTGIGMAPDEIPKALSKFGQIDGELSRRHDGTGLGLPIAKSLIEMHGGALEIESQKGKGTEIRVWLPKERLSEAA